MPYDFGRLCRLCRTVDAEEGGFYMSKYLKIIENTNKTDDAAPTAARRRERPATKATEATKAPVSEVPGYGDKSDRSDKRVAAIGLTLQEALAEINHQGSGAAKNAELYRRGQLSEEKAVEYVTCAILRRRGSDFAGWRAHAPTVRAALTHGIGCDCEVCL
jgi:hypothetical protein